MNDNLNKYSKDDLIEIISNADRKIKDVSEITSILCEIWNCENCPCVHLGADKRTEEQHIHGDTCQEQLWNWIVEEIKNKYI